MLRHSFCAIVMLASSASLSAQESRPLSAPPEFAIDQWTTEHGLPQNSVNAIVQAPDGYLWIGTFGGLARFDGTGFTLMERTDSAGRHVDRVLSLAIGADSTLWIGTETGLLRLEDGEYSEVRSSADGLPEQEIRDLHIDGSGRVWLGMGAGGLAWTADGTFRNVREAAGAPVDDVISIVGDAAGTVWVNTEDGILAVPNGDAAAAYWHDSPADGSAELLLHDRAGDYWFNLPRGMARVSGDAVGVFDVRGGSVMVQGPAGGYWVGTINDGVSFFESDDAASAKRYPLPDGRVGFRVQSAHVDDDGSVWLGTNADGLLRARRNLFTTYTSAHGLSHDVATAVFEDAGGTLWAGTNCGGVNAIDPERRTVRVFNPRSPGDPDGDPCIFALTEGPDATMWQGSYGRGVTALPWTGGATRESIAGLRDGEVLALFTDRDGTMWVGTRTGGLAAVEDRTVRATYTTADGLAHNSVRTIYQARDGALWIGTIEGLSRFSDNRFTNYTAADGLSAAHVRAIHEDQDGTLWIGTYGGGLNRFRDGEFTPITRQDGLGDDVVSAILEDDADNFWMSGNRGIYRVSRRQLNAFADGRLERVHSVLYGRADGLRNPETNGGFQPAGWKDSRGTLWFPTVEGLASVDPARIRPDGRAPSVAVEEVVVDGVSRQAADVVVVGPGRPNLEFRYAGLSLSAPEHVQFRYRLEGYDADWVDAGTRRVAYYPRLPAGNYAFTVRAANRDGVWGDAAAGLRLRVVPPYWSTWWFRVGAAVGLLGLGAGLFRRREAIAREDRAAKDEFSRRLIESQEHERRRLAGELHDGLAQELLIVRNRALLALRVDGVEIRVRDQLRHITDLVSGSLRSIRELAHNLTPHQLEHLGISSALETMIDAVAQTSGIELDASIEQIDGLLPLESEINLYRIVQEGLSNVVRHSGAGTAGVHVRRDGPVVRVTIVDRGRGFHLQRDSRGQPTAGFGLSGMAERARILDGSFDVRSAPGEGVRIEVSVPVAAEAAARAAEARTRGERSVSRAEA